MDESTRGWELSREKINSRSCTLANTLKPLLDFYDNKRDCYPKLKPWSFVRKLTSVKGSHFFSFAKYTRFRDDLYSGLIVKYLKRNLYVKSWGRMRHRLPSNCSTSIPHHVYNVKTIKLNGKFFRDTVDHSKWCVTPGGGWTCIADTNREVSQMRRGGGAICINDVKVRKAFSALISRYEQCKTASPP
ncbi:Deoxyribonuclease-2-beta [Collichthys lucidus]|uniref:Deoxyribonuclease-2-alpha n=1 Tax=Collichthys lucidus TaxID=240159 RepID=A0A4U5UIW2_COLLU|nr:Deoxyribonuclease-2-beta [Collichthys lucidus]